jgi:hypothetical protein
MSNGLASVEPDGPLYRLGRPPDPWAWPDWSYAAPDGTFGNRYDDPHAPPAVPRTWLDGRLIGEATVEGRFVDVGDTASLATLRTALAAQAHHGLDGSTR